MSLLSMLLHPHTPPSVREAIERTIIHRKVQKGEILQRPGELNTKAFYVEKGLLTLVCALGIWKNNVLAVFLAALVGGLLDVGYFVFMDLGGFVNFAPGTVMTLFSGAAIAISIFVYYKSDRWALFQSQT